MEINQQLTKKNYQESLKRLLVQVNSSLVALTRVFQLGSTGGVEKFGPNGQIWSMGGEKPIFWVVGGSSLSSPLGETLLAAL